MVSFCNLSTYSQVNEHAITGWTVWDPNQINWIVQNCRCDFICDVFRNNNDIVTGVPFWLMGYRHHGDLQYINYYGNIRKMSWWQRFKDSWRGRGKALKKFQLFDGMYDHSITGYADKLGKLL